MSEKAAPPLRKTTDAYGYTVTLGYDAAGSHNSTTDSLGNPLWSGNYAYGIQPFLTSSTDADRGSWSYTMDALGERIGWTDADGQSFGEAYDVLSRPTARSEPDTFTQWTWGSSASSHNIGRLQAACTGMVYPDSGASAPTTCTATTNSAEYVENETYDSLGRLYQRTITPTFDMVSPTFTYTFQYDPNSGLLSSLTYPTSPSGYALELQYGYSNGAPQSITDISDSPNVTIWQANAADPAGQITQESLSNGTIVTNRAYDAVTHWLSSVQSGVNGGSGIQNLAYLYDEMGNVEQRQDNNQGLTENIYYDDDYRFSYSQLNGTQNLSVMYDMMGDITSRSDVAAGASWTYDATHLHAVDQAGGSAYAYGPYDANGNPSTARGSSLYWWSDNYLYAVAASTGEELMFGYGPDRQRWGQIYWDADGYEEATFYAGPLEMVSDYDQEETLTSVTYRDYIFAGSEPVAIYSLTSGGNTLNYLETDQEGSISAITNSSGQSVVNESFTAFGDRRNPSTWSGPASASDLETSEAITRQDYTFQTLLGEDLGFNHLNGRVEDAITGRFLSPDPYIQDPTSAQDYNRYSYVLNNPLTSTDPTGFDYCIDSSCMSGDDLSDFWSNEWSAYQQWTDPTWTDPNSPGDQPTVTVSGSPLLTDDSNGDSAPFSNEPITGGGGATGGGGGAPAPGSQSNTTPAKAPPPPAQAPQTPPKLPHVCTSAGDANARAFVSANAAAVAPYASELNTSVGNLLGLSALETGWGSGSLVQPPVPGAEGANNYFGLEAGTNFATGEVGSDSILYKGKPYTFWAYDGPGIGASANAFAQSSFGAAVWGTQTAAAFVSALNPGSGQYNFNSRPGYDSELTSIINEVNTILSFCPGT